jgi:cyclohexyl-isocyanide hydratase
MMQHQVDRGGQFGPPVTRRALAGVAALLAASGQGRAQAPSDERPPAHDMSNMPKHWMGDEDIVFVIYPAFTALDMVGPHYMLTNLMGARVHIVAKTLEPVRSDTGLVFTPSATFETAPAKIDLICVPGGTTGTLEAMKDEATVAYLEKAGANARFVTSVCTGSLLLGAAGLLNGYRATSHWVTLQSLSTFGAIPTKGRIVRDRNRITGGGVTAGIDFGLTLVAEMRDKFYAETVQLLAEYAPEPPFNAGSTDTAPPAAKAMLEGMFQNFLGDVETAAKEIVGKRTRR